MNFKAINVFLLFCDYSVSTLAERFGMSFEEKTTNLNPLDPRMFLTSMVKVGPVVLNNFF